MGAAGTSFRPVICAARRRAAALPAPSGFFFENCAERLGCRQRPPLGPHLYVPHGRARRLYEYDHHSSVHAANPRVSVGLAYRRFCVRTTACSPVPIQSAPRADVSGHPCRCWAELQISNDSQPVAAMISHSHRCLPCHGLVGQTGAPSVDPFGLIGALMIGRLIIILSSASTMCP